MDIRHQRRIKTVQNLFALSFAGASEKSLPHPNSKVKDVQKKLTEIDEVIKSYAQRYPIEKIAKVDLAILRLAVFELLYERKTPPKVVVDEAVILAKELGNDKSYAFINGVLGAVLNKINNPQ